MKRLIKSAAEQVISRAAPLMWRGQKHGSLLVLMYHRVLPAGHPDRPVEQPGMYVSPETLAMHIQVLREFFEIVHLDEWLGGRSKSGSKPACALTFDDGWRDNFDFAFPVLQQAKAPATIFLVSTFIDTDQEFWPNRLARLLAHRVQRSALPKRLADVLRPLFDRSADDVLSTYDLDEAIQLCKGMSDAEMHALLDEAQRSDGTNHVRSMLNREELQAMAASGLIRYGSHTRTHYRCRANAPATELEREILQSRDELASALNSRVTLFCYPNGDTTPEAVELVGKGYDAAVTTQKGWLRPGLNRYLIPRVGVHEDVSARRSSFLTRISCWI